MGSRSRRVAAGIVAIGIAAGAAACSSGGGSEGSATPRTGAEIYADDCATCHASDGAGGMGPALGDGAAEAKYSEADTIELVTEGSNAMPAWKGRLSEAEIAAVVAYVRDELGRPGAAVTPPS
jgi:mono/diheme cytochrome c family protein